MTKTAMTDFAIAIMEHVFAIMILPTNKTAQYVDVSMIHLRTLKNL